MEKTPNIAEIRQYLRRAKLVEKYMVSAKLVILVGSFFALWALWRPALAGIRESQILISLALLLTYTICNLIYWFQLLFPGKRMQTDWRFFKMHILIISLMDNLFIAYLFYLSPETSRSGAIWIFGGIIVRNTLLFPNLKEFGIVTASLGICYFGAIVLQLGTVDFKHEIDAVILRILVLVLFSSTCWGVYHIVERRKKMIDEDQEKTIRMEKLHLAGLIAGEIAHELKNPLAIMNNAIYILGKKKDIYSDKAKKQIDIIDLEIKRSDKIITELLDYARLAESQIEDTDVNEIAINTIEGLKQSINEKNVEIETNLRNDLPNLFIDKTQLKQFFANLILNACEAIVENGKIIVTTSYGQDDTIEIAVADNGRGIEEKVRARIFEPFYTTKRGGTGLGLSIVNNIVQAYGGEIVVESKKGEGTSFLAKFPVRTGKLGSKGGRI